MPEPVIAEVAAPSPPSLEVAPDSLTAAADALRSVAADLIGFGDAVTSWQRPVGTDEVMGPGNADRSWRHLSERWGTELHFYGSEVADLAEAVSRAAAQYEAVESEVSVRCRG